MILSSTSITGMAFLSTPFSNLSSSNTKTKSPSNFYSRRKTISSTV
nr:MAG TPA: hypothetical protein [Caudoviricetes sp.]